MTSQTLRIVTGDPEQQNAAREPKDLLYGVPAIADFLGLTERQARHQCESRRLPTFRMGAIICSRRSTLNAWLAEQEAKARRAPAN